MQILYSIKKISNKLLSILFCNVYFAKNFETVPNKSIVFFPLYQNVFFCGLAGIVAYKKETKKKRNKINLELLENAEKEYKKYCFLNYDKTYSSFKNNYLGGNDLLNSQLEFVNSLKTIDNIYEFFKHTKIQNKLAKIAQSISNTIEQEKKLLEQNTGYLNINDVDTISNSIETVKDICWCITNEILKNIQKIRELSHTDFKFTYLRVSILKQVNAIFNSIDYLEVRGRDSAGISLMFTIENKAFKKFNKLLKKKHLIDDLNNRQTDRILKNNSLNISSNNDKDLVTITFSYKIAAEVGKLGDNILFLRNQIKHDLIFQIFINFQYKFHTILAHTRWASVGAITEYNCHPVDNKTSKNLIQKQGVIHVCLNGDIDNYIDLKNNYIKNVGEIGEEITSDTKIIPLQIEYYLNQRFSLEESFRLAVNDFEGSHAISMHTDLCPGKIFLAQKGSGQAVFIGIADDFYMPVSEVYGFVEETSKYIKIEGEKPIEDENGTSCGQVFVLDQNMDQNSVQNSDENLDENFNGISARYYNKTKVNICKNDIKYTDIKSKDINRQNFDHYFLKEISESPKSVEKTLQNRWKINEKSNYHEIVLSKDTISDSLKNAIVNNDIKRIYFIGQGTAGVAAKACANILDYYLNDYSLFVSSLKSSELSGFKFSENDHPKSIKDTLVIAITQSGTTTDTNKTIDMAKDRGAYSMAIVNRRDSDITFKVDGVMYTSSGRDIEMSVASTKAFYSQIIAGAVLGLYITQLKKRRSSDFISQEINQLLMLPKHMNSIFELKDKIKNSARKLATKKVYWAAVGSGPNKVSADEIRIKLSELCYKTISSDYVEDKKHIDLSSEPLIIVCAAGTRETVINDIIKDTAIFQAHKASSVVITNEDEDRFSQYAEDIFYVPVVSEHFAPILNTLVGHLWGYYAALEINEGSKFLFEFRSQIQSLINNYSKEGLTIYEIILEKGFRELIAKFYTKLRKKRIQNRRIGMRMDAASDLLLLLKYLSGSTLPVSDFELDFGIKGTAQNMLNTLFECLSNSINALARPIDAIKHQAKTVTVGTSRVATKIEGILFDEITNSNLNISQLTTNNIIVLKNLQNIVSSVKGSLLYKISNLNFLGEPTDKSKIEVIRKEGGLKPIPSRVEKETKLKGSKKIIVRRGNVYIGRGRRDGRMIIVIPLSSSSSKTPSVIEFLLLLNVTLKEKVSLKNKIKALGGKYEHITNIVQENNISWKDKYLELVEITELFGKSAEKIAELIVSMLS